VESTQGIHEGREGQCRRARFQASTDDDRGASGGGTRRELAQQAALADAGLAADEHPRPIAAQAQRRLEADQLGRPPDETARQHVDRHDRSLSTDTTRDRAIRQRPYFSEAERPELIRE
jgi:hypothetical protein